MADALFELEQNLRSRKDKLTRQEETVLLTCKSKVIRDFSIGACVASGIVWPATQMLGYLLRINLVGGAAIFGGIWRFGSSIDSCLDHILALTETRMQQELAKLIITKHWNDPWKMQLIRKYFYVEKVFSDSSLDQPIYRWRPQNYIGDYTAQGQRTHETDICRDKTAIKNNQFTMKANVDVIADPLDCVFGYSGTSEEIHHPNTDGGLPKRRMRSHKRAHRRHRTNHPEVASSSQYSRTQVG